jgi:hypothetical protein
MEENKLGNINFTEINGNKVIKSENSPFAEGFHFSKFYDEKAYKKFITNVERLIRMSTEYKSYVELLHTNLNALNIDNILSNITLADAEIEFHHYPVTLFEVVDIIAINNFLNKKDFTSFSIAKEVMELHYKNLIGLVPLTKTNHDLAHSGNLFLSDKQVFGDYRLFVKKYDKAVSNELKEKIKQMEDFSAKNTPSDIKGLL